LRLATGLSVLILAVATLGACAGIPKADMTLNTLAERYVRLALEIDVREPGYVDAYFGPEAWRADARAADLPVAQLKAAADLLLQDLNGLQASGVEEKQRLKVLTANVASARFRLDMIGGVRVPFREEAQNLFGQTPDLRPLATYDAALARIDRLVPGEGALPERIDAFRSRYVIPPDKLKAVMNAAISECRKRTAAHINLPKDESFTMETVTGVSWGAYNYYKGAHRSLIQINVNLPVPITSAIVYGCHEGYPGHHVQGIFNEKLYRDRGWVEFSVAPLYAPASSLNEGGADFGIQLAFPGDERAAFEVGTLFPLAGLDPATAPKAAALQEALAELNGATLTIAEMYLDGTIDRAKAVELTQRYQLASRERAETSVQFLDDYRSYTINYSVGEALIRAYVNRQGDDAKARWAAYVGLLTRPTLPSDLLP
jgi:hypothetical protein